MTEQAIIPKVETVKLGTIEVSPQDVISRATNIATQLAKVIDEQKLYSVISKRKYVRVEGWNTLGAILGILPREVEVIEHDNGDFEATVELIRVSDGAVVGRASSIVGADEKTWANRDRYAKRSMSVTRATGKAFRLGFSWIIKLAGYEPTPAEEMPVIEATFKEVKPKQDKITAEDIVGDVTEPEPSPEYDFSTRPYNPETLQAALMKKCEKIGVHTASDKQRNLLGALLSEYFQDDTKRYTASRYLFGAASTKEIAGEMVRAALDWLNPGKDDGGAYRINDVSKTELGSVLDEALKVGGQESLL